MVLVQTHKPSSPHRHSVGAHIKYLEVRVKLLQAKILFYTEKGPLLTMSWHPMPFHYFANRIDCIMYIILAPGVKTGTINFKQ